MKARDLKVLRSAAKILKKSDVAKPCSDVCWGCWICYSSRLVQEYASFVNDWLIDDEAIEKYMKNFEKTKKRLEKKNPK